MNKLARVRVDERFEPRAGVVVLYLHDVSKRERAVLLDNKLECCGEFVKLAVQLGLSFVDSVAC